MPLSEHEQRMLDDLERQLFAEDPRLARTFAQATRPRRDRRRILTGIIGVVAGLGLLILAVALPAIWLGIVAFGLMVAAGIWAATAPVPGTGRERAAARRAQGAPGGSSSSPFMRTLEQRWDRRRGGSGLR